MALDRMLFEMDLFMQGEIDLDDPYDHPTKPLIIRRRKVPKYCWVGKDRVLRKMEDMDYDYLCNCRNLLIREDRLPHKVKELDEIIAKKSSLLPKVGIK